MAFNWELRIPWNYGDTYVTLRYAHQELKKHYHPEYIRRVLAWWHYKNGYVGAGSRWRASQPDKPGAAPEGRSFHQDQRYSDGFVGACAIDMVVADGPDPDDNHDGISWDDVPVQGSAEAKRWGLHANVGNPTLPFPQGEAWHIQPIEIDGYDTWLRQGRPAPVANYPLPAEHDPFPPTQEFEMFEFTEEIRLLDTRDEGDRPAGRFTVIVPFAAGYRGAMVTLTATDSRSLGYVRAWDGVAPIPPTSKLNFRPEAGSVANTTAVKLSPQGTFDIDVVGNTHLVVDLVGVWS